MRAVLSVIVSVFMMLAPLVGAVAEGAKETSKAPETISIALTAPLTGDYSEYGIGFQRSVELAADFINAQGGLLGKQIKILVGDSKGDPKESANLAQKWTSDPAIVAQIGDFSSSACMAGQPIFDSAGMVQLSPTASHPNFAPGSNWSFSIVGTQAAEGPFMAEFTYNTLGIKSLAILHLNNDWGISTAQNFAKAYEKLGGKVTATEFYFDGERDFTAVLTKLRDTKPEGLFMASFYQDGAAISMQRDRLGWKPKVVGPSSLYNQQLITIGGPAVNGIYSNTSFFAEDPDPMVQKYVKEYTERYKAAPFFHAALAFDAMNILADAITRAGSLDKTKIRDTLAVTKDFPGITGKITFQPAGDVVKEYRRIAVENGKFTLYSK